MLLLHGYRLDILVSSLFRSLKSIQACLRGSCIESTLFSFTACSNVFTCFLILFATCPCILLTTVSFQEAESSLSKDWSVPIIKYAAQCLCIELRLLSWSYWFPQSEGFVEEEEMHRPETKASPLLDGNTDKVGFVELDAPCRIGLHPAMSGEADIQTHIPASIPVQMSANLIRNALWCRRCALVRLEATPALHIHSGPCVLSNWSILPALILP